MIDQPFIVKSFRAGTGGVMPGWTDRVIVMKDAWMEMGAVEGGLNHDAAAGDRT